MDKRDNSFVNGNIKKDQKDISSIVGGVSEFEGRALEDEAHSIGEMKSNTDSANTQSQSNNIDNILKVFNAFK